MYVPAHFEKADVPALHALIRAHPLGTWATLVGGELEVNHVPFLIEPERGRFGTLVGHVARANPVWDGFATEPDSLVAFHGPQAYVSPSWYASKAAHGRVVPTWNYAVVHAYGRPRAIEDRVWLRELVTRMSAEHEAAQALPWKVADAPSEYTDTLLGGIVGIEIPITRLVGTCKASQNRTAEDRRSVIAGLRARRDAASRAMADLMEGHADDPRE